MLARGAFAVWPLTEGGAATTADNAEGTSAFDGSYQNAPNLDVAGPASGHGAATFDGVDQYVSIGALTGLAQAMADNLGGTLQAWIRTTTTAGLQTMFIGRKPASAGPQISIGINRTSAGGTQVGAIATWCVSGGNAGVRAYVDADTGICDGNWHHLAVAFDLDARTAVIVVDGAAQSVTYALQTDFTFAPGDVEAAEIATEQSFYFAGTIGGVAVLDYRLTLAEIQADYASAWTIQAARTTIRRSRRQVFFPPPSSEDPRAGWQRIQTIRPTGVNPYIAIRGRAIRRGLSEIRPDTVAPVPAMRMVMSWRSILPAALSPGRFIIVGPPLQAAVVIAPYADGSGDGILKSRRQVFRPFNGQTDASFGNRQILKSRRMFYRPIPPDTGQAPAPAPPAPPAVWARGRGSGAMPRAAAGRPFFWGLSPVLMDNEALDPRPITIRAWRSASPGAAQPGRVLRWAAALQVFDYPPLYHLYDMSTGKVLIDVDPAGTSFDLTILSTIGLVSAGGWTLGLARVDQYGTESDPADAQIIVEIEGDGDALTEVAAPETLTAVVLAAGMIRLRWQIHRQAYQALPAEFEVADAADLATPLVDPVTGNRVGIFEVEIGPFSHGQTVRPRIRATDGASFVGPWVGDLVVIADNQAPPAAEVVAS